MHCSAGCIVIPLEEKVFGRLLTPAEGCWEWSGARTRAGYGLTGHGGRKLYVHRVMFELAYGFAPPKGMEVCHHCDNPPCARPNHLFLGTHAENMQDRVPKGRTNFGERNPLAKLTWVDVRDIRSAVAAGATQASMCRKYGVSAGVVCDIIAGKRWKERAA